MTTFYKTIFLDAAFDVFSKSPYILGPDWGKASDAVSDAYDAVHPTTRQVTRAEIDIRIDAFMQAAEENLTSITKDSGQAFELVEDIRCQVEKALSPKFEPTV